MKTIDQISDDEIVDAVASCGRRGLDTEDPWDGNAFFWITVTFGLLDRDVDDFETISNAEGALAERMRAMPDRLVDPDGDRMHLTSAEWGRRLAGKSAEEIAKLLGDFDVDGPASDEERDEESC